MKQLLILVASFYLPLMSLAYNQAFPRSEVGAFEIKTLPASVLIASQTEGHYFEDNNGLFRPLFDYINTHGITMTTPVEAEIDPGVMYFYIGEDIDLESLKKTDGIELHNLPERIVASYGVRGRYSEENFEEAAEILRFWISKNKNYEQSGEARGVFWHGPFVPGIFKRFEVHIPVLAIEK